MSIKPMSGSAGRVMSKFASVARVESPGVDGSDIGYFGVNTLNKIDKIIIGIARQ
jgi:hypothetical protein